MMLYCASIEELLIQNTLKNNVIDKLELTNSPPKHAFFLNPK